MLFGDSPCDDCPMKKYMTLIEGIVIGIAGLVMVLLGWADDSLKWILLILSPPIIVASVAIFFFQNKRETQDRPIRITMDVANTANDSMWLTQQSKSKRH